MWILMHLCHRIISLVLKGYQEQEDLVLDFKNFLLFEETEYRGKIEMQKYL